MTLAEQALARELARHPDWTWQSGMMMLLDTGDVPIVYGRSNNTEERRDCVPDLADPATQGCIMVAIGDVKIDALDPWVQWRNADGSFSSTYSDTLGEALARAWLAVHGGERCGS